MHAGRKSCLIDVPTDVLLKDLPDISGPAGLFGKVFMLSMPKYYSLSQ